MHLIVFFFSSLDPRVLCRQFIWNRTPITFIFCCPKVWWFMVLSPKFFFVVVACISMLEKTDSNAFAFRFLKQCMNFTHFSGHVNNSVSLANRSYAPLSVPRRSHGSLWKLQQDKCFSSNGLQYNAIGISFVTLVQSKLNGPYTYDSNSFSLHRHCCCICNAKVNKI